MGDLLMQNTSIFIIKLVDLINVMRTLSNQCAFDERGKDINEFIVRGELFDVLDQLGLGNSTERILDSGLGQCVDFRMASS